MKNIPITDHQAIESEPSRLVRIKDSWIQPVSAQSHVRFAGRDAFETLILQMTGMAVEENWTQMCWMDLDFADWPLNDRHLVEALQAWSRTGRRMQIMAKSYDCLIAKHHRFVSWRRQWAHIIECWKCPSADVSEFPSGIIGPRYAMHRIDRAHGHALMFDDASRIQGLNELRDEWLEKSTPGFPAHVLGL